MRGFAAFENDRGARRYLALVRTDSEHGLSAGIVSTPEWLDNQFGGTVLARQVTPDMPTNREVRHQGEYAGLRQVPAESGPTTTRVHRVEGRVELQLDFFTDRANPAIEGVITGRRNLDAPLVAGADGRLEAVRYEDIVLRLAEINARGEFQGEATGGTYFGMIAGDNAAASAGIVMIGTGGQTERGAFFAREP